MPESTKDLFQSKKPLFQWWAHVTSDPLFAEVLLHARSVFIEMSPTESALLGAREYERIWIDLAEASPSDIELPSPGLHHNIEEIPPRPGAPEPPPKPQPKQLKKGKK
jgi:hypothetical protein